jgi:para-aminobenzoate synthetase
MSRTASATSGHLVQHTGILESLQALSADVGETALFKTLPFDGDIQQLSNLCYSNSDNGSAVMLQSTKRGRHSIFAFPDVPSREVKFLNGNLSVLKDGKTAQTCSMPVSSALSLLHDLISTSAITDGTADIPFWGGLVGFISYEAGLDMLGVSTSDDVEARIVPEFSFLWVNRSIVVDHQTQTVVVQSIRKDDESWLLSMVQSVKEAMRAKSLSPAAGSEIVSCLTPSHEEYLSKIRSCQSSLHAGDSYELCLTTSATLTTTTSPFILYNQLQRSNPAPYAAFLKLAQTHVLSSSPEQFLSWPRSSPTFDMMPMKGTLAKSPAVNTIACAREILLNPKEEAENLMIADLIRHDLHSSLGPSSRVEVRKLFEVTETESLYQLISHIQAQVPMPVSTTSRSPRSPGKQREERKWVLEHGHKALRSALPPGSMTGAPKKRSCEILRSLEKRNRGVYSGVIGYFDIGGGGGWSVAIRCAFSHESEDSFIPRSTTKQDAEGEDEQEEVEKQQPQRLRKWHIGAGGAITVLSEEEAEWEEMRAKLGSVLRGFGVREEV